MKAAVGSPFAAVLFAILLHGCSTTSLRQRIDERLHEGKSRAQVLDLMGSPDSSSPSREFPGAVTWVYRKGSEVCGVVMKNDQVATTFCAVSRGKGELEPAEADEDADSRAPSSSPLKGCVSKQINNTVFSSCP